MQEINGIDKLELEGRKRLSMTGVNSVDGFSEQYLKLTVNGSKVQILGDKIKITSFNQNSGNLSADGKFNQIKYDVKKEPIFKRIFKWYLHLKISL